MSWSFLGVGKPAALKAAIDKYAEQLTDQSKAEFDAVAPHLKGILDSAQPTDAVHVSANGHASFTGGERVYAHVGVEIKQLGPICE